MREAEKLFTQGESRRDRSVSLVPSSSLGTDNDYGRSVEIGLERETALGPRLADTSG